MTPLWSESPSSDDTTPSKAVSPESFRCCHRTPGPCGGSDGPRGLDDRALARLRLPCISACLDRNLQTRFHNVMKRQIIRISVLQSSKIVTVLYTLMGFIYTLIGIPMIILGNGNLRIIGIIYLLGPIFAAVFGFIFFVIFAGIYNLLATALGGFEIEVRDVDQSA